MRLCVGRQSVRLQQEPWPVRKQLRRTQVTKFFEALPPCLIGMDACATAHYWARELTRLGHQVRLMPAKDVKAYVKRNSNDAAHGEAICEAVRRPMSCGTFCAGPANLITPSPTV